MNTATGGGASAVELARFYREHLPTVYGYLHRLCGGDGALAEDLTQDTWIRLAEALRQGRSECADIGWLLTVARNHFIDHTRRAVRAEGKLRLASVTAADHTPDPSATDVLEVLESLEPMHRLVLMLRYVEDLTVPDVAAAIGRNVTATNSLLARARTELRATRRSAS